MKQKMNFQALAIVILGLSLTAQAREKWDNNHHSSKEHDCKKEVTRVECPVICIDKVPFRIKESGCYLIKNNLNHSEKCPAITVEANRVKIEFCNDAVLSVGGCSTGIKVKGDYVSIINGVFNTNSENTRAIELCSGIKNWNIEKSCFNNFSEAISATNFLNGALTNCDFLQCRIGFQQNGMESVIKNFLAENIRAEYNQPDPTPCPGFDFSNNDKLSWVISLNGEVINATIQHMQLISTAVYCFKCRDCRIDDVELTYTNVICEGTYGIQCGGPRGAETFRFFVKVPPPPAEIKQGCQNCRVSNCKVRMASPEKPIIFMIGIVGFFCTNCEMTDNLSLINSGPDRLGGVGLMESYCTNCVLRRCQAEGPCLIGLHVCDAFDMGEFCFASVTEDCKARNAWYGITQIRCFGSVTKNSISTQNNIGILLSEGATNPVVDNCYITENGIGVLYAILGSCNMMCFSNCFSPSFTPDSNLTVAAPCNGLLSNCVLNGNITAILEGPVDVNNPTGPKLVLETESNIVRQFVPGCGAQPVMTNICQCLIENNCP